MKLSARSQLTGTVTSINSGDTTGPHLHFGIPDGPDILTSNGLPFEIRSSTVQGTAVLRRMPGAIRLVGTPRHVTSSLPLIRSVASCSV
jgi:murein DD-endopeptidase MepM/ murein hydrolase activator NlpD